MATSAQIIDVPESRLMIEVLSFIFEAVGGMMIQEVRPWYEP